MDESVFLKRHRPQWQRLEAYAARLEGRGAPLSGPDLFSLVSLYRQSTGDLARARLLRLSPQLIDYLNQLVGRLHFLIYAPPPYPWHRILDFFRRGFPAAVRRQWRYVTGAALLLVLPALASFWAVQSEPSLGSAFAPPGYVEQVEKSFGETFGKEARPSGMNALATSFYIINNVQVSFLAFSTGVFVGLGSAYILVFNGIILGGVGAVIHQHRLSYNFWSFVASHGGIELGAILLAGAAGMRVGFSLVNPGLRTRTAALVHAGREAGLLMAGVVLMLGIAAMLEAWVSPSPLPQALKFVLGSLNLVALVGYLGLAGRSGRPGNDAASAAPAGIAADPRAGARSGSAPGT
ncbi:MAG TPA: stage II sporulation protein M [Planctomycetota bacterium]|nr:stage II sporulation protein M [Planctomycetota bacterium]